MSGRKTYHYPRTVVVLQVSLLAPTGELTEIDVTTIPISVEWTRNDINEADEASIVVDWSEVPLDPRAVSDCRVVIYCADVGSEDRALSIADEAAARFIGFVDEPEVSFDESGETVTLACRDYTGRLIDTKWRGGSIRVDRPLSEVYRELLAEAPPYVGTELRIEDDRAVAGVTGRKLWTPPSGVSVWDCLVGLAKELGQTARWELGTLVVATPTTPSAADARLVVYGDQVERMTLRRSLNPVANKRIVFRALDTSSRKVVEGQWPATSEGVKRDEVAYSLPAGDWSPKTLVDRAKHVYTTWMRRQVQGSFDTVAMSDLDSADLVSLASGDQVYLQARSYDPARVLGKSRGELASYLRDHGLAPTTANALASAWVGSEDLASLFYVVRARHSWSRDAGYKLAADIGNVIGVS